MGVATKKIAQYHSNNTNDLETRRAKAWPNRTFGSAFFKWTCAEHMRSRKKRKVVVCTIVVAQTSDTSDTGVVAQREVDQCVSILVQTTSTFFSFCLATGLCVSVA